MKNLLFVFMLLVGLLSAAAPFLVPTLNGASATVLLGFGLSLTVLSMALLVIVNVYVKTRASEAFVRTGAGGLKVIMDGGALVIPVIHEMITVSLETLKLDVQRAGEHALITKDNLRCDIGAEFFVKVEPNKESVIKAAQSLGMRMRAVEQVKSLVEDKLISALRSVAAETDLADLHSKRSEFVSEVTAKVNVDLRENGLTLETVTISKLDQTDIRFLKADGNVFDAQGRRKIAEITEAQNTARNELERAGQRARTEQDVNTKKQVLALHQAQAEAEATNRAAVSAANSASEREAREKEIIAQQAVQLASVEQQKVVQLAQIEQQQVAQVAQVQQQQAVQVQEAQREQAVAEANRIKAEREAELQKALANRQKEQEQIQTVSVVQAAEREKEQAVIAAQGAAESRYVTEQRLADAKAYQVKADAEARKAAADADAEAKVKAANAEKVAALARVDATQAEQLIPVNVQKEQVQVEKQRVNVEKDRLETVTVPELQAREKHGKVAQDFEIAKFQIEQEAHVRIETAKATASIVGKIEGTFFGTPDQVKKMTDAYMFGGVLNEGMKSLGATRTVAEIVGAVAEKVLDKSED